jgi:hypothetical protein
MLYLKNVVAGYGQEFLIDIQSITRIEHKRPRRPGNRRYLTGSWRPFAECLVLGVK